MYIFGRAIRLAPGDPRQQLAWAAAVTEKVNQISEVPVMLWSPFASPQPNVLAWSAAVPTLGVLEATSDKLAADDGYLGLVAEGAKHTVPDSLTDSLVELIHTDADVDPAHLHYVTTGTATAAQGHMARAAELGVEIAKMIKEITGCPTSFGVQVTGPYGSFRWSTYLESIEQLEESGRKIRTDARMLKFADGEAGHVFGPEPPQQVIVRRVH